jgi:hypothetical protein
MTGYTLRPHPLEAFGSDAWLVELDQSVRVTLDGETIATRYVTVSQRTHLRRGTVAWASTKRGHPHSWTKLSVSRHDRVEPDVVIDALLANDGPVRAHA